MHKFKCCRCGEIAELRDTSKKLQFYCLECASKYKNILSLTESTTTYSEGGFNKKDFEKHFNISIFDVNDAFNRYKGFLPLAHRNAYECEISKIYMSCKGGGAVNYNLFMSRVGHMFEKKTTAENFFLKIFYDNFKNELKEKKVIKKSS